MSIIMENESSIIFNQNERMRGQKKDKKTLYKEDRVSYPTRSYRRKQYDN